MSDWDEGAPLRVPIDIAKFQQEAGALRAALEGPLQAGADRAGQAIEASLLRAVRTGKLGFDDLKKTALSVLAEIAAAALQNAIGGTGGGKGSTAASIANVLAAALGGGAPGRATGGPVSPQRPYWVGERGPELFVPTASGRIEAAGGSARNVNVAIRVQADAGTAPDALARSGRQVARAVRAALAAGE